MFVYVFFFRFTRIVPRHFESTKSGGNNKTWWRTVDENAVGYLETAAQHVHVPHVLDDGQHGRQEERVPHEQNENADFCETQGEHEVAKADGRDVQQVERLNSRRAPSAFHSRRQLVELFKPANHIEEPSIPLREQRCANNGQDELQQKLEKNHLKK